MKVKYELTPEDFKKDIKYIRWNIREIRNKYIVSMFQYPILLFGFVMIIRTFDTVHKPPISYLIVSSIILGIILSILTNKYYMKKIIKKYQKDGGHFCVHTVEVNEEGVREMTNVNDTLFYWKNVKYIFQNEEYIFILFKSMTVITIPKRDFDSIEEINEYYEKALTLWKEKVTVS